MAQGRRGCGCLVAVLVIALAALAAIGWKFVLPWWKAKPPRASGGELQIHVLDVGQGDAILIISPTGKAVLVDAGDTGKGQSVRDALSRYNVQQLDYFIATHAHPDHIGGASEVLKSTKILNVIDSGIPPPNYTEDETQSNGTKTAKGAKVVKLKKPVSNAQLPTTRAYADFLDSVKQSGAQYVKAEAGQRYDLGGGVLLSVLAPIPPAFTREQMRAGGNEPNANSIVAELIYGDFSMLLAGDAEAQTEDRLNNKGVSVAARILKVAHHGSKYATSDDFLKRVKPEAAIISDGEFNRYGHPSPDVLTRLQAAQVKVYRTDLQGEITITSKGGRDYEIKTAHDAKSDVYAGREAQKDDSARSGFIAYGDFGPPPKPMKKK